MKITFILPAIGKIPGKKYIKSWQVMEPLPIMTMKALTPPQFETEFFDDRIELIDYNTKTDLVAISCETYTARRSYLIAEKFQARGIPVVMGGYHPTLMPEEVAEHADAILIGNAERVWPTLLEDVRTKTLKKVYQGTPGFSDALPDRSILAGKKYSGIGLVETGRGCSFNCDFCAITSYYSRCYIPRDIPQVVADVQRSGRKMFFFVDDNVVAQQNYAIELCKALAPLKIKWSGQGSLTMARNPELLKWMKKSGCDVILIGFESLDEANLRQMKKTWMLNLGDRDELVQRIHDAGISIYSTFVFGHDNDTPDTFQQALDFSIKHGFFYAAFNHITPFPATPLYEQLKAANRLLTEKWWLDSNYRYGTLPFHPKKMTYEEVTEHCAQARRDFYKYSSIFKRLGSLLTRNWSPLLAYIFFHSNALVQEEIDIRLKLPMGLNLDELPK